jgi:opacity protein-like surface antigen
MPVRHLVPSLLLVLVYGYGSPSIVQAQGAIANAAVGIVASEGSSDVAISGGIGYRFNRVIGFGIEFTHVPNLDPNNKYGIYSLRVCCGYGGGDAEGHATMFTTNVRIEVPTTMRRVIPFVVGGGGIASLTERFPLIYYAVPLAQELTSLGLSVPTPNVLPGPQVVSSTTLAMGLTLGGGASVLVTDHLAIDADLRVLKLLADNGQTIGRFQIGASYRF